MRRNYKQVEVEEEKKITLYTKKLTDAEADKLEAWCQTRGWGENEVAYARFAFKGPKINLVFYSSGKLVIQGKMTEDFVRDVLEPEITLSAELGYEEVHHPEWFEPHAGMDESGKGDLFGPVICATVIADGDMVRQWMNEGIKDSKKISDGQIIRFEKLILKTKGVVVEKSWCGMPKYNELMSRPRANLNKLIAWLHAKALEAALDKRFVDWGMLDQFSKNPLVQKQIKRKDFDLKMEARAEADPVVAAASVIARAEFLRQLKKLSTEFGEELLKGAGAATKEQATRLIEAVGPDRFGNFAKLHFKTSYEALGLPPPKKPQWSKY
ncbi:MAG: ribonuclease HIII [Opitutaceae bacterium]|nr:ribonuclease HIII [Opitutaceae bacterium]|tara:strand:+ start:316 stop:1290 length:975 start_codon:yes stop_codon:yes gene_type:complete